MQDTCTYRGIHTQDGLLTYIPNDTISYPMFVHGIRVYSYPESVVSHEAVGFYHLIMN